MFRWRSTISSLNHLRRIRRCAQGCHLRRHKASGTQASATARVSGGTGRPSPIVTRLPDAVASWRPCREVQESVPESALFAAPLAIGADDPVDGIQFVPTCFGPSRRSDHGGLKSTPDNFYRFIASALQVCHSSCWRIGRARSCS